MKTLKYLTGVILLLSVAFWGCEKEGTQGPEGPQGPTGATGPTGQQGNANVNAFTYTVSTNDWQQVGTSGQPGFGYGVGYSNLAITQDVMDNGAVLGYADFGAMGAWSQLPYTFFFNNYTTHFGLSYELETVAVFNYDSDLQTLPFQNTILLKVVVIEGSQKRGLLDDVDTADYYTTMKALGLEP